MDDPNQKKMLRMLKGQMSLIFGVINLYALPHKFWILNLPTPNDIWCYKTKYNNFPINPIQFLESAKFSVDTKIKIPELSKENCYFFHFHFSLCFHQISGQKFTSKFSALGKLFSTVPKIDSLVK